MNFKIIDKKKYVLTNDIVKHIEAIESYGTDTILKAHLKILVKQLNSEVTFDEYKS